MYVILPLKCLKIRENLHVQTLHLSNIYPIRDSYTSRVRLFLTTNIHNKEVFIQLQRVEGIVFLLSIGLILFLYLAKREEFKQLKEAEQRRRTLINSMVDFVNFKDGDGRWLESNTFGLQLFQLEHVDYKGKKTANSQNTPNFIKSR